MLRASPGPAAHKRTTSSRSGYVYYERVPATANDRTLVQFRINAVIKKQEVEKRTKLIATFDKLKVVRYRALKISGGPTSSLHGDAVNSLGPRLGNVEQDASPESTFSVPANVVRAGCRGRPQLGLWDERRAKCSILF